MPSVERRLQPHADVPLAPLGTLGVGGHAAWFVEAATVEDVAGAHAWAAERKLPLFVLGGGSNLVINDDGIGGLVLRMATRGVAFETEGAQTLVRANAGEPWDAVVAAAVARGLAGFECLSGIPGSVGGTPIQNVGAYGQEVANTLEYVTVFDRKTSRPAMLGAADCGFGYRMSRFKSTDVDRFIVCDVTFRLQPGPPTVTYPDVIAHLERSGVRSPDVAAVRDAVLAIRRRKGMVLDASDPDTRSVGSFFMNPVVSSAEHARLAGPGFVLPDGRVKVPAAWLIEQAGFPRGYDSGRVGLSSKHPLAIINRGGATARDVLALAARIKRQVADRFGVLLRPEPIFAGFGPDDSEVQYLREA